MHDVVSDHETPWIAEWSPNNGSAFAQPTVPGIWDRGDILRQPSGESRVGKELASFISQRLPAVCYNKEKVNYIDR